MPDDLQAARERREQARRKRDERESVIVSSYREPDITLNVWAMPDGNNVRQLTHLRDAFPCTNGMETREMLDALRDAAIHIAADLSESEEIDEAWRCEPVICVYLDRQGWTASTMNKFVDDERGKWKSVVFMLRRLWNVNRVIGRAIVQMMFRGRAK